METNSIDYISNRAGVLKIKRLSAQERCLSKGLLGLSLFAGLKDPQVSTT